MPDPPRDRRRSGRSPTPVKGRRSGHSARSVAWHVLVRVDRDDAFADRALHAELRRNPLERRDRAFATELCYGTLRLRGRLDHALDQVIDRDLDQVEPEVLNLLRVGAYQILYLHGVRDAAAVDETVHLARAVGRERATGFVNGVLRALARRATELRWPDPAEDPVGHLVAWGSLPEWLAERCLDQLGADEAIALAQTCAEPPPRTVRVAATADPTAVQARLGGRPCDYAPRGLTGLHSDPARDPGFAAGEHTIQDEASQLVVELVGAKPDWTVVDCCAAPGGKTVQLAERVGPGGEVIAFDSHAPRLTLVRAGARRMGFANVRALVRDVTQGFDLQGRQSFPAVLVDAPCSGLGVLRRNPDARWNVGPGDIAAAAVEQSRILDSVARYVETGGVLVYSVCTFTPEETTDVIARFLEAHPGFALDDPRPWLPPRAAAELVDESGPGPALRTWPQRHGCDGFYAARLVRDGDSAGRR